ncbi:type 1 glutamine amidotransferase [bacterium]|nr:type 1 glutamine amidotransferase [bacterium]
MKILILDNAIDHNIYRPVDHWVPHIVFPFDSFRASNGKLPNSVNDYSHIIISGSEASIVDDCDWYKPLEELIREAAIKDKVILGSCFGHQMIARALFGKKTVRHAKVPEHGWFDIEVLKDDLLLPQHIVCLNLHFDEVYNIPLDKCDILATTLNCKISAFKLKNKPIWGIQPHPEIGIEEGLKIIKEISKKESWKQNFYLKALKTTPRDSGWIKHLMEEFQKYQIT